MLKPCAFALLAAITGCAAGASGRPNEPKHDAPVPDAVPRAVIEFKFDLEPAANCEESFDLAMYEDRGVDLIKWDAKDGKCSGRTVEVRYLPSEIAQPALLAKVQKLVRHLDSSTAKEGK